MTSDSTSLNRSRFHALDGLRASMMLLGLVLHAACNYQDSPPNEAWSFRDDQTSPVFSLLVLFIHAWRMPIFMLLAGFFGALLVDRRGNDNFLSNRMSRLALPFVLFLPVILPLTTSGFGYAVSKMKVSGFEALFQTRTGSNWTDLFPPITIHMWFIYYLILFSICAYLWNHGSSLLLPDWLRNLPRRFLGWLMKCPGGTILLSIPLIFLLEGTAGLLNTGIQFIPESSSFFSYGFLYICGWALWRQRALLEQFCSWPRTIVSLLLTAILFLPWLEFFLHSVGVPAGFWIETVCGIAGVDHLQRDTISLIGATLSTLMIWNSIWGFLGLFMLIADRNIPLVRYIVDGSYWVYLIHLPFCIWIPGLLADVDVGGAVVKFFITLISTTVIGFVSYDLLVRNSAIGEILNGRRWPRALGNALRNRCLEPAEPDGK